MEELKKVFVKPGDESSLPEDKRHVYFGTSPESKVLMGIYDAREQMININKEIQYDVFKEVSWYSYMTDESEMKKVDSTGRSTAFELLTVALRDDFEGIDRTIEEWNNDH